ncbi:MAG: hypothetical protein WCJ75_13840 [Desulfomonile sp.]
MFSLTPWRPIDPVNPPAYGPDIVVFAWGMKNEYGQVIRSCSPEERDKTMDEWNKDFRKEWRAKSPEARAEFKERRKQELAKLREERRQELATQRVREARWRLRLRAAVKARGNKFGSLEDLRQWSFADEPRMKPHGKETYEAWEPKGNGRITGRRLLLEDKAQSCINAIVRLQFSNPSTWQRFIPRMSVGDLARYCCLIPESKEAEA